MHNLMPNVGPVKSTPVANSWGARMVLLIGWLDTDDLVIVIGAYWNVVVTLIVLFINLIIWKWVYTLGHTFVKFVSGPYFPHKSL